MAALAAAVWGIRRVELSPLALIEGWPETSNLLARMWPPFIPREDFGAVTSAVFDTFFMAFAGTAIGLFLAIPLALGAASNVTPWRPVRAVARAIIVATRAVPAVVLALIFVRVYGIGVLPGILAIGIHAVGMLGKLLADAAEEIDPGPREGVLSTGASGAQDVVTGVWRQMVPAVISVTLYRLEIDFRGAAILGLVGAGGIGTILRGYQGGLRYQELLGVTLLIIVLVVVMETISALTRRVILGGESASTHHPSSLSLTRIPIVARWTDRWSVPEVSPGTPTGLTGAVPVNPPWTSDRIKLTVASVASVVTLVLSFIIPDISLREFVGSIGDMPSIFWRLVPQDMAWLTEGVVSGLIETVAIGLASTAIALVVAIPFSFLAASNTSPGRWVYRISRLWMLLVRATPELVLAVIFVAALGLGPATGTIAMSIMLFGFVTKLFADSIEEARQGPRDGVFATGATRIQDVATGVTPQVMPALLGNMLYVFDVSLRASTVIGIVGGGGIGFLLNNAAKTLNFEVMGGIIFSIFVIVYGIELLANWLRKQVI